MYPVRGFFRGGGGFITQAAKSNVAKIWDTNKKSRSKSTCFGRSPSTNERKYPSDTSKSRSVNRADKWRGPPWPALVAPSAVCHVI